MELEEERKKLFHLFRSIPPKFRFIIYSEKKRKKIEDSYYFCLISRNNPPNHPSTIINAGENNFSRCYKIQSQGGKSGRLTGYIGPPIARTES